MKSIRIALVCLAIMFYGVAHAKSISLRVMSYNIKNGNPTQENTWEVRRPILVRSIAKHEPDVIGTQEGFFFQIKQIVEDLPQYDWIGLGRAGGSKDEMMAILFKQDRFEVMAFDHFWLSDTPEIIGSRTWGHDNRRMVTWVRFKDSASGIEFYHWNTHFDHREQPAREKSATLLLQRLREVMPPAPAVVTGDFNAAPDNPCYATLVAALDGALNLRDTWGIGGERVNDGIGSFNRWEGPQPNGARIDWILATPEFSCTRIEIDTYEEGGQYPSDHFPVIAELVLETGD